MATYLFYALVALVTAAATAAVLFVAEVVLILKKRWWRPSFFLAKLGTGFYNTFWGLAYVIGLFGDVFGIVRRISSGLRHVVLLLRDKFFGFIPKEVIYQAFDDLRHAYGSILKAPLGFFWGLWDSIAAALLPWLSFTVLLVNGVVIPSVLELLLLVRGVQTRPSTLILALVPYVSRPFWALGYLPAYFKDLGTLLRGILSGLFYWIPMDRVEQATRDIVGSLWNLSTAAGQGFNNGVDTAAAEGYEWGEWGRIMFALALTIVVLFMIGVLTIGSLPPTAVQPDSTKTPEEDVKTRTRRSRSMGVVIGGWGGGDE
jgi:hypothetical protein